MVIAPYICVIKLLGIDRWLFIVLLLIWYASQHLLDIANQLERKIFVVVLLTLKIVSITNYILDLFFFKCEYYRYTY